MSGITALPAQTGAGVAPTRVSTPPAAVPARAVEVVLDLSRLLSRVLHATPTGVDRCEMAYARGLLRAIPERLHFAALHPGRIYGRLDRAAVLRFLDETEHGWDEIGHAPGAKRWHRPVSAAQALLRLRPGPVPPRRANTARVFVQASPHHLEDERRVAAILRREHARFVCLVHDLIPIEYPEYARAGGAAQHLRRIMTLVRHANGIVTNSAATRASFARFTPDAVRAPMIRVAHLGVPDPRSVTPLPATDPRPYFVVMGTIEPRKNHLLLLNLWRQMAEAGAPVPRLVLIGRRGWENEQVVDMLERCAALKGHVEEHGRVPDREVHALIAGARALLMPSFAEGYGMPVSEALALGTPVICSDLPAHREAGGDAPVYLDPLDGAGWMRAIRAAVDGTGPPRPAPGAVPLPIWHEHIAILLDLVHRVAA